jgi:4-hydroxy-3-polyprenylbenzoate decarboxylase
MDRSGAACGRPENDRHAGLERALMDDSPDVVGPATSRLRRIIVGITGATGAPIAVRMLELLRATQEVELHVVMSQWAHSTIELETGLSVRGVKERADVVYRAGDLSAAIASGSFPIDAMVVVPCSMKTLAGIRAGYADTLIQRAADVTLKEGRPLVLVPREMPLSQVHLENMLALARMGVRIVPPMPAFYTRPQTIDDVVTHIAMRVLDQLGLGGGVSSPRWDGGLRSPVATDAHALDEVAE